MPLDARLLLAGRSFEPQPFDVSQPLMAGNKLRLASEELAARQKALQEEEQIRQLYARQGAPGPAPGPVPPAAIPVAPAEPGGLTESLQQPDGTWSAPTAVPPRVGDGLAGLAPQAAPQPGAPPARQGPPTWEDWAKISPTRGLQFRESGAKAQLAESQASLAQITAQREKFAAASDVLYGVRQADTQAAYDQARPLIAQILGPEAAAAMPAVYDRAIVEAGIANGVKAKERLEQMQEQRLRVTEQRLLGGEQRLQSEEQRKAREEQRKVAEAAQAVPDYGVKELNPYVHEVMKNQPPGTRPTGDDLANAQRLRQADLATQEEQKKAAEEQGKYKGQLPQQARKAETALQSLELGWRRNEEDITQALALIDDRWFPKSGPLGWATAPRATPGYRLKTLLETIRANVGFDRLQQMREASPTGGALGQVSDFENRLLQATAGSLDENLDATQLKRNLARIREDLQGLRENRRAAFQEEYGQVRPGRSTTPPARREVSQPEGMPHRFLAREDLTPAQLKERKDWLAQEMQKAR